MRTPDTAALRETFDRATEVARDRASDAAEVIRERATDVAGTVAERVAEASTAVATRLDDRLPDAYTPALISDRADHGHHRKWLFLGLGALGAGVFAWLRKNRTETWNAPTSRPTSVPTPTTAPRDTAGGTPDAALADEAAEPRPATTPGAPLEEVHLAD